MNFVNCLSVSRSFTSFAGIISYFINWQIGLKIINYEHLLQFNFVFAETESQIDEIKSSIAPA